MNENRHRTVSLMNDIHPEYVVNVAFGGAKDGIDGKVGKDGEPGKDGAPGEDGFSPIVEAYRNPDDTGIIVRVTDKDGTRETYVQDGTSSSSENEPVLYIEDESQYTSGYSILKYDSQNIPDGYDYHYLDSTFIMQIVAIGHGEFSSGKRYSAYFAISFAEYSQITEDDALPAGITNTFLYGDFEPTFEIRGTINPNKILSLELFDVGESVENAGFEDFKPGLDVAIYIHHYSGRTPYDEFAGFFERTDRINPSATPASNYTYLVDVNRSELFNQRLDDVLRFRNSVTGDLGYTTDTSIRATDIEMSTDGDKPGKISLEAAETINGQTRIQSGRIWLGDYSSSGDYEKLITLDAINNNWRTYQTIIQNGELSLKDFDQGYRTIVISGASSKPYIDMRSDSNSSTHSIKLQVNGDKGSTNILNGQIVLKDENGNKQIDISSRTNGKGIVKLSDKKLLESTKINNTNVVKLFTTNGTNLFTIDNNKICYGNSLLNAFIDVWSIDTTVPVLPTNPSISVDDSDFYPTGSVTIGNPNGSYIVWTSLNRYSGTRYGVQGLTSSMETSIQCYGNEIVYSNKHRFAYEDNGSYTTADTDYYTYINNGGYADILSASVSRSYDFDGDNDTGLVELRDAMGNDVLYISTENDDNGYQYTSVQLYIDGGVSDAHIDGDVLTRDDRILLGDHKLSDIVTYNETFTNSGSTLQLKNNTIYTASGDISNKSFSYSGGDCIIEFSTAGTGSVTMHFPMTITFDEWPTFGNDEHWIIGIRDGWAVWTKYDLSQ